MKTVIFILLLFLCVLAIIAYSLCVMAHDADERAKRIYKEWKEDANGRTGSDKA